MVWVEQWKADTTMRMVGAHRMEPDLVQKGSLPDGKDYYYSDQLAVLDPVLPNTFVGTWSLLHLELPRISGSPRYFVFPAYARVVATQKIVVEDTIYLTKYTYHMDGTRHQFRLDKRIPPAKGAPWTEFRYENVLTHDVTEGGSGAGLSAPSSLTYSQFLKDLYTKLGLRAEFGDAPLNEPTTPHHLSEEAP